MRDWTVPTRAGGQISARDDGDPNGFPVFAIHGTPGCRLNPRAWSEDAKVQGIRLLSFDRAGYGGSTPVPDRRVSHAAEEVAAIADSLGIARFGVWGISGGGAPALACAALLPRRVVAAVSLAGVAPFGAPGLDWFRGMGELNVSDFQLLLRDAAAWDAKTRKDRDELLVVTPEQLSEMWASLLSDVDRHGLTPPIVDWLFESLRIALAPGYEGLRDDGLSQVKPWGFELSSIRVPVQVWHGAHDRFVPLAHGAWLAAHVPGADAHLLPDDGHLTLFVRHMPEVHRWIHEHA